MINSGQFQIGQEPWNRGKKHIKITNEKHALWKGDKVGYRGLHYWITRKLGKPKICSFKDLTCKGRIEWANTANEYTRDLKYWLSLCISHHRRFDNERRRNGHA